jgi:hypothetical protein
MFDISVTFDTSQELTALLKVEDENILDMFTTFVKFQSLISALNVVLPKHDVKLVFSKIVGLPALEPNVPLKLAN